MAEEHINLITLNDATTDTVLKLCIKAIHSNIWHRVYELHVAETESDRDTLKHMHALSDELCISDDADIVLRGNRIVIHKSLQKKIINIAHEGHQGVVKTKKLLQEKVWFSVIDKQVENTIDQCLPCHPTTVENSREPLQMSPLPEDPWQDVSADFCDPLENTYLW